MTHNLNKTTRIATKWFNTTLKALNTAQTHQQLFNVALDIKKQLDFNSIAYGLITADNFKRETYYIYSDEPEKWKKNYIQKRYWKIDTRIIIARQQIAPFRWRELSCLSDFIVTDIIRNNMDGMTVPVHGPNHFFGFIHFTYNVDQKKINSWLQYIKPFVVYVAQSIIGTAFTLSQKQDSPPDTTEDITSMLSLQQRRCLAWAAEGKTTEEIALILGISVSTVNKHIELAAALLNANNRTHAIAKAIDGNLIALEYKKKTKIFYF